MSLGYVPEEQRDTRWWIWNSLFMCRVPYMQSRSVEDIQFFGMPTCGDLASDRELAKEKVTRMLTIAKMLEYFAQGTNVAVVKMEDTKIIYERITDHLNAWKRELANSFHTKDAPLEDLMLMDRFANAVYAHARYQFTPEIVNSLLARKMEESMPLNKNNILGAMPPAGVLKIRGISEEQIAEQNKRPDRASMEEIFASRKAAMQPKWS